MLTLFGSHALRDETWGVKLFGWRNAFLKSGNCLGVIGGVYCQRDYRVLIVKKEVGGDRTCGGVWDVSRCARSRSWYGCAFFTTVGVGREYWGLGAG